MSASFPSSFLLFLPSSPFRFYSRLSTAASRIRGFTRQSGTSRMHASSHCRTAKSGIPTQVRNKAHARFLTQGHPDLRDPHASPAQVTCTPPSQPSGILSRITRSSLITIITHNFAGHVGTRSAFGFRLTNNFAGHVATGTGSPALLTGLLACLPATWACLGREHGSRPPQKESPSPLRLGPLVVLARKSTMSCVLHTITPQSRALCWPLCGWGHNHANNHAHNREQAVGESVA